MPELRQKMMKYAQKCPRCGGEVVEREVTEILSGGVNTAFVKVKAGICRHCGERLFSPETIRMFEKIETKLERKETADFQPLGSSFQVI